MTQQPFPFPGLEPPEPDPRLRSRVLRAAWQAAAEARTGALARLVDRLWENRALRLAWLTAVVALLLLNATFDTGTIGGNGAAPADGHGPAELDVPEIAIAGRLHPGSAVALRTTDPVLREELGLRARRGSG